MDNSDIYKGAPAPDPLKDEGREVLLPVGLSLAELQSLSSSDIDDKIKQQGAGIGYAGILKLAAGHGKTPAGTQLNACAFLLNRAAELADREKTDKDLSDGLRGMPRAALQEFVDKYEAAEAAKIRNNIEVIDVIDI